MWMVFEVVLSEHVDSAGIDAREERRDVGEAMEVAVERHRQSGEHAETFEKTEASLRVPLGTTRARRRHRAPNGERPGRAQKARVAWTAGAPVQQRSYSGRLEVCLLSECWPW